MLDGPLRKTKHSRRRVADARPNACQEPYARLTGLLCHIPDHPAHKLNELFTIDLPSPTCQVCGMTNNRIAEAWWEAKVKGWAKNGISEAEKAVVTVACQRFIDEVLKPRFLPVIQPTEFNYPIDIYGKWHGARFRFIQ